MDAGAITRSICGSPGGRGLQIRLTLALSGRDASSVALALSCAASRIPWAISTSSRGRLYWSKLSFSGTRPELLPPQVLDHLLEPAVGLRDFGDRGFGRGQRRLGGGEPGLQRSDILGFGGGDHDRSQAQRAAFEAPPPGG